MNDTSSAHPDLEERFLMPKGWRWHVFKNTQGRSIRFGTVSPENHVPDAVVIGLQGLGEYTEKYFEIAHTLLEHNLSFWMIDWQGQGKSQRHLKDTQKRHSASFEEDIADLHCFIMEYVKHAAVHPDVGRIPLVMLGHSMGANIGLRYLKQYPDIFACAAFTAPMVGIKALKNLPHGVTLGLTASLKEILDHAYVGFSDKGWHPDMRENKLKDFHSSDPVRQKIHNAWCLYDKDLQVGNITYGWLHEANLSCFKIQKKHFLDDIKTPALFALAGKEKLVDNNATRKLVASMNQATILELQNSRHEILMECDSVRNEFLKAFDMLLQVNNIKEKLKPF